MYNYDFKDKWEGKKEAGMPKKYTKYDENGYRVDRRLKNEKYGEPDPMDDSAFGKTYTVNNINTFFRLQVQQRGQRLDRCEVQQLFLQRGDAQGSWSGSSQQAW